MKKRRRPVKTGQRRFPCCPAGYGQPRACPAGCGEYTLKFPFLRLETCGSAPSLRESEGPLPAPPSRVVFHGRSGSGRADGGALPSRPGTTTVTEETKLGGAA